MSIYFSKNEIRNALKYKHDGKDDSIMAFMFMGSCADYLIDLIPKSIHPNLISLLGFYLEIITFVVTSIYSDFYKFCVPFWACFMNGAILFVYLILDSLDGRQARRSNISSSVGHFFDHGIGALTTVIIALEISNILELHGFLLFHLPFLSCIGFALSSWEEYVTNSFYRAIINPRNEGLLLISILHIANGVNYRVARFITDIPLFGHFFIFAAFATFFINFFNVAKKACASSEESTGMWKRAVISILPVMITIMLGYGIIFSCPKASENMYYIIFACLLLAFQSQMLITGFLVKRTPVLISDKTILLFWAAMVVAVYFPAVNEMPIYWGFLLLSLLSIIIIYDIGVIDGLRFALMIPVFTVSAQLEKEDILVIQAHDGDDFVEEVQNNDGDNTIGKDTMFENLVEEEIDNVVMKI